MSPRTLSTLDAVIERRLLVNYRADPDVVTPLLPLTMRPQLIDGAAVVGICLIRLAHVRPAGWPSAVGLRSENAAHRIAVEWDEDDRVQTGVYIPVRHASTLVNVAAGGRAFPGVHRLATFDVEENTDRLHLGLSSRDHNSGRGRRPTVGTAPRSTLHDARRRVDLLPRRIGRFLARAWRFSRWSAIGDR